jgi:hypothetical protein
MDLTVRLQRHFRRRREHSDRVRSSPLCWTQAPRLDLAAIAATSMAAGLLQVLWHNRGMIGNPRYGPSVWALPTPPSWCALGSAVTRS